MLIFIQAQLKLSLDYYDSEDDDDEWYDEGALEYYLNPRFYDPILASAE